MVILSSQSDFDLYVDGSYNPKTQTMAVGWAAVAPDMEVTTGGKVINHEAGSSTMAEIMAIVEALFSMPEGSEITVFTDYEHAIDVMAGRSKTKQKFQNAYALAGYATDRHSRVAFEHVREAAGNRFHEMAHVEAFKLTELKG